MPELKITYHIDLDEAEAFALKKLLGNMNDQQFSELGIKGEDRQRMSEIYDLLPYDEQD